MSTRSSSRKSGSSHTTTKAGDVKSKGSRKKSSTNPSVEQVLPPPKKLAPFTIPKRTTESADEDVPLSEFAKVRSKSSTHKPKNEVDLESEKKNDTKQSKKNNKMTESSSVASMEPNSNPSADDKTKGKRASTDQHCKKKSASNDDASKSRKAKSQTQNIETSESKSGDEVQNESTSRSRPKRKRQVNESKETEAAATAENETFTAESQKTSKRNRGRGVVADAEAVKADENQEKVAVPKRRSRSAKVKADTPTVSSNEPLSNPSDSVTKISVQELSTVSGSSNKRKRRSNMSDESNETEITCAAKQTPKSTEKTQQRPKRNSRKSTAADPKEEESSVDSGLQASLTPSDTQDAVEEDKKDCKETVVEEKKPKPRGRPRTVQPATTKAKRGRKPAGTEDSTCDEEDSQVLSCHHCDFTCSGLYQIKSHYAHAHILWYTKADPQGLSNPKSLKKVFAFLGGKVTCHICQKSIKTPAYYRTHVEWCNSDQSLMERCDICDKEYKAFWINEHRLNCLKKTAAKKAEAEAKKAAAEAKKAEHKAAVHSSGKRRAATKALSVIKNINEEKEEIDWNAMFTTPHMTVPSAETISQWKDCVNASQPIKCTHEGCEVQDTHIEQMTTHYWTCPLNGLDSHTWNCRKCTLSFHSEKEALKHAQSQHAPKSRKRKLDDGFNSGDQSHGEEEDDDISSGVPTEDEDGPQSAEESESEKPRPSGGGKDAKAICQYLTVKHTEPRAKLCASLHSTTSAWLPTLLPDKNRLVAVEDQSPEGNTSIKFKIDDNPDIHCLTKGETITHSSGYVTYLGEAMNDIAWCPASRDVESGVLCGDQYIAVVSSNKKLVDTRELCSYPDSIQIWKVASLISEEESVHISLNLTLTHNFGYIYQMKWCYNDSFLSSSDTGMDRLGLLALAASDGSVHIASVPLIHSSKETGLKALYSIDKELKLSVSGNKSQCLCVDWQRMDNKFIFAGFSDGSVALWYVGAGIESTELEPVRVYRAHVSTVTAISCCPFHADLFTTYSHGWLVWDMKNLSSPYLSPRSIDWSLDLHTKAVWPRIYQLVIACTDPSFGTYPISLLSLGYDFFIANQKVPIRDVQIPTDLDICDCSDVLAVSEINGAVRCHCPIVPTYVKGAEKGTGQRTITKWNVVQTEEVREDSCEEWMIKFEYLKKEKERFQGTISTQCDVRTLSENKRTHSINSVSLNPNAAGHGWLVGGGQHGILHLIKFSKMFPNQSIFRDTVDGKRNGVYHRTP